MVRGDIIKFMEFKKNDIITIVIEDVGVHGEGIGKIQDETSFTFFVKDAVIGDVVEAKIMKVKKNYAYAKLMKIITPSSQRVEPKCLYNKQCGGCQIQALAYPAQLMLKTNMVKNNLIRIGGFSKAFLETVMEPIIGMEQPFYYRNKAQFPIGVNKNGEPIAGFYAERTHVIISNTDCALGAAENRQVLEMILSYMKQHHVSPYMESTGTGIVRHVLIRKGFATGEIMVCVIINADKLPFEEKLTQLLCTIKGITSISININKEKTNVIMGRKCRLLWGNDTISDVIYPRTPEEIAQNHDRCDHENKQGIVFAISPLSFYQVNPIQTEKLYSIALEYAGLTGTETVWDLYCGIGTISLFMARQAKHVYGVEIVDQAITDARKNAARNGIQNVDFYVGKAEEVLPNLYETKGIHADVICIDPPRKGCDQACLETIVKMQPKRVVYVSCDSATLARDLKYLCENGYEVKRARMVDMFAQTVHVEVACCLQRKDS